MMIPDRVTLSATEILALSNNRLAGTIPSEVGLLMKLREFSLSRNFLESSIPPQISDLKELGKFLVMFVPPLRFIEQSLTLDASIEILDLQYNDLTSTIPLGISRLTKLTELIIGYNALSGGIPRLISNLEFLETLVVGPNKLSAPLISEISLLRNLSKW